MSQLRIEGGTVYDPRHGIDGEVRDILVDDGRIVDRLPSDAPRLDARGLVVMPGGVDIHAHVAGGGVAQARRLLAARYAEDAVPAPALLDGRGRSGGGGPVPTTFTTGYRYAGLGYTTVIDAAVAPLLARSAHADFDDTPIIDGGFLVLLGNDDYVLRAIAAGDESRAIEYAAWMLGASGGYGIKLVNPGGVERWKAGARGVTALETEVGPRGVTPRRILETLVDAANRLGLPHGAHVHANGLGLPGNAALTLESMRAVEGRRVHFTHVQFHSYGGDGSTWRSGARDVIAYVNAHPEVTIDVGQVLFGPAATVSADGPVEYLLHASAGRPWTNVDIELETGCGVVPLDHRARAAVSALQWVVGLELFLLAEDPWRVLLSTDHPNGGSFVAYPELIRLLMDRAYRDHALQQINPAYLRGSALADGLAREYTLYEIAIVTRAGPARVLGLSQKGHLGPGADADITVYDACADRAVMFATPRYVLKGGVVVVEEGQLRRAPQGHRLHVRPPHDARIAGEVARQFAARATTAFSRFPVRGLRDAARPTEPR